MEDKMGMLLAREDPSSVGVLLFSPSPDPSRVQTKLQATFQTLQCIRCSLKTTTQWLKSQKS